MRATSAAETTNEAPSTTNAGPGPRAWTVRPPTAGPAMRSMSGLTKPARAFACGSSSSGTRSGTMAVEAGLNSASPRPTTVMSATTCQSWSTPAIESSPIAPIAIARRTSATIIIRRGSYRSDRTPPASRKTTSGTVAATPTIDIAVGTLLIAYTCHASATYMKPSPRSDTVEPAMRRAKSRWRSGPRMRTRPR